MVKWVGFRYGRGQSVQGPLCGSVTGKVSGCLVVPLSEYNVALPIIINNLTILKVKNPSLLNGSHPFLRSHSILLDTEC